MSTPTAPPAACPKAASNALGISFGFRAFKRRGLGTAAGAALSCAALLVPGAALGFPHIVQKDESLADLAERYYGRVQMERVIVTANALDHSPAKGLAPGMILEIPALTYHRVVEGETWKSLATTRLGSEGRYITLAQINGHKPWIEPELGQLIRLPYNLAWTSTGDESLATLAYRFLGSTKHAYQIVQYNDLGEDGPERGHVLLLPLSELKLTDEGNRAAIDAASRMTEEAGYSSFATQKDSEHLLRQLGDDVRGGRYISAVERGTRLLAQGQLPQPLEASVHHHLLEAAVALGVPALARSSCQSYLDLAEAPDLDPITTSPKILRACEGLAPAKQESASEADAAAPGAADPDTTLDQDSGTTP